MELDPEQAGVLYIDGHYVSITVTKPNRRDIMLRGRNFCLERPPTIGSMAWMTNLLGWLKVVDPGLIKVIENDILAQLGVCLTSPS